jgi:hypothetical protein
MLSCESVMNIPIAAVQFILPLPCTICLKNGTLLFFVRSFVIDVYKPYKIIMNNITGCWKAALDRETAFLHVQTFYNGIIIVLNCTFELEHA